MANYWLKRSAAAPAEGPLTGGQIKRLAAAGQITSSALLSPDNAKWTPASKVKGLFPEPAATPAPAPSVEPVPVTAPVEANIYDLAEDPAPAQPVFAAPALVAVQPLAYASDVMPLPRNIQWYLVSASVLLVLGIVYRVLHFAYGVGSSFTDTLTSIQRNNVPTGLGSQLIGATPATAADVAVVITAAVLAFLLFWGMVGLYIYFTVWAYLAHRDFQQFTRGDYPIGPARACGFCWIPLFNVFWLVYMPYKLAEAVEWHLGPGRAIVKPTSIAAMQLGSCVACCCVGGLPSFLLASTAKQIQTGLNALWLNPIQVPLRRA